jgi:multicomponent K+:H+ antiporter subunit A
MLIAYWYHRATRGAGAGMALTVTATGGLCLRAAVMMLGHITGSYELDRVLASVELVRHQPWYPAVLILVLIGAFTKSAQFPFHFWLPHAMAAPTPVSAYLHSATMVKAGVFLLARFWPVLAGTDLWFAIVCSVGLASLLLGAYAANFQRDMKGVLAYSTISHLGLITLLLGMNSPLALVAAVFHMMNHATFKASLFMAAGIVDHESGTRDLNRLSGLAHAMPITATLALVAAAAMAGVPLLNGFLSKEMFFAETIFAGEAAVLRLSLPAAATVAGIFGVAYSLRFVHRVFFGPPATNLPRTPHEPRAGCSRPARCSSWPACSWGYCRPARWGRSCRMPRRRSWRHVPAYSLALWHGFTMPFVTSLRRSSAASRCTCCCISAETGPRAGRFAHLRWQAQLRRADRRGDAPPGGRCLPLLAPPAIVTRGDGRRGGLHRWRGRAGTRHSPRSGRASPVNPAFALMWIIGAACAIGAASKRVHRLAASSWSAARGSSPA